VHLVFGSAAESRQIERCAFVVEGWPTYALIALVVDLPGSRSKFCFCRSRGFLIGPLDHPP
jgi:hypothetical protein